ncbi:hypothetical protein [Streptomyces sp. NPDC002533]
MNAAHAPMPSEDDCWEAFWDVLASVVAKRHESGSDDAQAEQGTHTSRQPY